MPKYNSPRKTWRYADEFKIRAVEISYQEGIQVQQVAEAGHSSLHAIALA